jgi:RNA polymerase sigma-70 factor (ECF subfamily)
MDSQKQDAAIVSLLTQNQSALRLYVESLMPGDSHCDDVAQETNTIIWEKRSDFEIGTNFKAWAFSIARFQVRKYRFKQAKDARLVFCEELEEIIAEEMTDHLDDLSEHHIALQVCLQKLKPADRDLIHHRYFKKTPLKEYAANVGRSIGGLKVTLHRIRNRLLVCVEKRIALSKEAQA